MFSRCSAELGKSKSCHTRAWSRPSDGDRSGQESPTSVKRSHRYLGQEAPKSWSGATEILVKKHRIHGQESWKSWSGPTDIWAKRHRNTCQDAGKAKSGCPETLVRRHRRHAQMVAQMTTNGAQKSSGEPRGTDESPRRAQESPREI